MVLSKANNADEAKNLCCFFADFAKLVWELESGHCREKSIQPICNNADVFSILLISNLKQYRYI